jgi:hypothetical protein
VRLRVHLPLALAGVSRWGPWRRRCRRVPRSWCSSCAPCQRVPRQPSGSMVTPLPARRVVCMLIIRPCRWGPGIRPRLRGSRFASSSLAPQPPCGSMPTPSPADTPVCSVIVDALVKVKGLIRRQPMGSMQLPVPARIVVVVRMAVSIWLAAPARLPRCVRRVGAGWRLPRRLWAREPGRSAAPGVERRACAGANACAGSHGALPGDEVGPISRPGRWPSRCPRGSSSWRSSFAPSSAVGLDARAGAGADARRGAHQPPHGSRIEPPPARTFAFVFIFRSPVLEVCAGARQPLGSTQAVYPARMRIVVVISRPTGPGSSRRRPGRSNACSSSSPVVRGAPRGRPAAGSSAGRRGPGLAQPSGSMHEPPPARTCVLLLIVPSLRGVRVSPAGRWWGLRPRAAAWWCSSPSPSAVGVQAGTLAGADRRGGVHGRLPQPLGSTPSPLPARMVVVALTLVLLVSRCRRYGRLHPRGRWCGWSCCLPRRQPLGSMPKPRPARMRVVVCMEASLVSRCRPSGGRRPRGCWSSWSSSVSRVSRCRPCGRPRPRGGWCGSSSRSPGRGQPSGSIIDPAPARTVVAVFIVRLLVERGPRQPLGSIPHPMAARRRVVVRISASLSAEGVDDGPAAGPDGGARLHRPSPGGTLPPLGSMADPAPARTWVMVLISASVQPSGSMKEPAPAWIVVVVPIVRLRRRLRVSRWGPCRARRRRGGWCSCAWFVSRRGFPRSAVGVDAPADAGANGGGGPHGPFPCEGWREGAAELPSLHRVRRSMRGCLCRVCDRPRRKRAAGVEP